LAIDAERVRSDVGTERVRSDVGTEPLARAGVPCRTRTGLLPRKRGENVGVAGKAGAQAGPDRIPISFVSDLSVWPGCCLETPSFRRPSAYSGRWVRASPPARRVGPGVVLGCFAIFPSFASFWVRGRTGPLSPH